MLDYGENLFGERWRNEVAAAGNLETTAALVRLDCAAYSNPAITQKVIEVFAKHKRNADMKPRKVGCEVAHHPDDNHLRLAIRNGGKGLRDKLKALLP
jgi:hypothetical protein